MRLRVKQARDRVESLRLALLRAIPEEMDAALPGLEEAIECLHAVERELREGACAPYEIRRELTLLKNDLSLMARLIEHGVAFCRGWASMLGAGPSYTQGGQPIPEKIAARLILWDS
jgi:hypothetical protein